MRKIPAVLLMVVGVPMLMGSLFLVSVGSWAFDRGFYKSIVNDPDLYAALKSGELRDSGGELDIEGTRFDSKAFATAFSSTFPEAEFKSDMNAAIDRSFDSLEDGSWKRGDIIIGFGRFRSALEASAPRFAAAYAAALPVSGDVKAETLEAYVNARDFRSRPANVGEKAFAEAMTAALVTFVRDMPSELKVPAIEDWEGENRGDEDGPGKAIRAMATGARSIYIPLVVSLVIWLVAGMLYSSDWSQRAPFMGGTLGVSSILVLVVGIMAKATVNLPSLARLIDVPEAREWLASRSGTHVMAFVTHVADRVANGFFITGLVAVSVAVAVTSLKWIAAKREI